MSEFRLTWMQCSQSQVFKKSTDMSVIGYIVTLRKHMVNINFWRFPEHKNKCVQEPLQNLFRQYPIIPVLTEGAFDYVRKWMCGMRAWETCQLHIKIIIKRYFI